MLISIHALREESDRAISLDMYRLFISIHALREESDSPTQLESIGSSYFNPRSP